MKEHEREQRCDEENCEWETSGKLVPVVHQTLTRQDEDVRGPKPFWVNGHNQRSRRPGKDLGAAATTSTTRPKEQND